MKKILLVLIIALFALSLTKTDTNLETYADFDDYDPIEIVRI